MDAIDVVLSVISVAGTASSIIFAMLAFRRNDRGDRRREGKNEGVLISDVGYIKSSIDRIEKSMDKLQEKYDDLHRRMATVEQKVDDHIANAAIHGKGTEQ